MTGSPHDLRKQVEPVDFCQLRTVVKPCIRDAAAYHSVPDSSRAAAEVRLLVAHAGMVHNTMPDLSPAGVQAALNTLVELSKAVVIGQFDDVEPRLAAALAQAAKNLVDSRLADPELSAAMLARELNVSLRTLQRAFAASGESVNAYVRDRRLEEARLALAARPGRLSVSE